MMRLPTSRIIFRHLLRQHRAAVTLIPIEVGHAVALEATLSFWVWAFRSTASLGSAVANGFQYLLTGQYWISLFPGLALFGLIASINLVVKTSNAASIQGTIRYDSGTRDDTPVAG